MDNTTPLLCYPATTENAVR